MARKKMTLKEEESLIEIGIDCIAHQESGKCPSSCTRCLYNIRNYTETDNEAMYIMVKAKQRLDAFTAQQEYLEQKEYERNQSIKLGCGVSLVGLTMLILLFNFSFGLGWGSRIIAMIIAFMLMMGGLYTQ